MKQYSSGTNFLSLYELDPVCCDQLVQTVYYPAVNIPLACGVAGCAPSGSVWLDPVAWDSPPSPAKVFAQMAVVVNSGVFIDASGKCPAASTAIRVLNAASYSAGAIAPDSIASIFGTQLAPGTATAAVLPLPLVLAGVSVVITDHAGLAQSAPLFYVSPGQINFLVPPGMALGQAVLSVYNGSALRASGTMRIEATSPGIFTENADGKGAPAGYITTASGSTQPVFTCGASPGSCVPAPIDFNRLDGQAYLILFGTGIRNNTSVSVAIDGVNAPVLYAGTQFQYTGLDQINLLLPSELAGRGTVNLVLTVDGRPANTVQLVFR